MKTKVLLLSIFCYLLCNKSVNGQTANITGEILYEDFGLVVGNIPLFIYAGPFGDYCDITADMYGQFSCTNLDCQVGSVNTAGIAIPTTPMTDYEDGLSIVDIIEIEQYLASTQAFDNYDKIAADAQDDKDIDTMDINAIRKIILTLTTTFPAPSWRFIMNVDKTSFEGVTFVNAYNYLIDEGYNGEYTVSNLTNTQITNRNWDIRAIKIGDLTGDHSEIRASISPAQVSTNAIMAGEEVELIFRAKNFNEIQGYQFGMHLNPAYVEILSIEQGDLQGFSLNNFGDHTKERGELRTMWYSKNAENVSLAEKDVIFKLKVKALQPVNNLQSVLQVKDAILPMEFIANGSLATDVALQVEVVRSNVTATNQELKVYPNPATDVSSVGFTLEEPAQVNLAIYDASGRLIKVYREQFSKGYNEFLLKNLPSGLLILKLDTAAWSAQSKLVNK